MTLHLGRRSMSGKANCMQVFFYPMRSWRAGRCKVVRVAREKEVSHRTRDTRHSRAGRDPSVSGCARSAVPMLWIPACAGMTGAGWHRCRPQSGAIQRCPSSAQAAIQGCPSSPRRQGPRASRLRAQRAGQCSGQRLAHRPARGRGRRRPSSAGHRSRRADVDTSRHGRGAKARHGIRRFSRCDALRSAGTDSGS